MNTEQFKERFYLERHYGRILEIEIYCRIVVKKRENDQEVTGIETKINTLDIGKDLADSQFTLTPISWGDYLNQTIQMLFNMLVIRLKIDNCLTVNGQESISDFFNENPFHEE